MTRVTFFFFLRGLCPLGKHSGSLAPDDKTAPGHEPPCPKEKGVTPREAQSATFPLPSPQAREALGGGEPRAAPLEGKGRYFPRGSKRNIPHPQSGALDALGRRAREAVPDSRSASEGRGSAKRERAA